MVISLDHHDTTILSLPTEIDLPVFDFILINSYA